ncbi:flagellar motor protein MotD [Chromatocurvus halotolerans]|uniref:Chemotaxis protein MotB n=1 Tax=Chromatocurvus halotolerans TaxID=1132028 RepID=A0A4V2SBR9_9GAMM|nr:flagellar motor protein MotD [Chromatocurvus halotolerans]TCO76580.1 chemotaxis protein MotB [Chromatocurvus halotolerans]
MGRKKRHEDHINHEAWAIPYGDLVTLLLAFFVVMYAISSVNEGKYRVLSDSLVAAFRGTPKTTRPIQIGDNPPSGGAEQGRDDALPQGSVDRSTLSLPLDNPPGGIAGITSVGDDGTRAGLARMAEEIREALSELIDQDQVRVRETPLWLEVEIKTDLLFPVGIAEVADPALPTLQKVGDILEPMPNALRVEGHTDDVPISTTRFPSNWELSSARASSVIRLFQARGVTPQRMVAVGLGEYQPAASNDSAEGRNRNRRVTIVILANDEMPEPLPGSLTEAEVGT